MKDNAELYSEVGVLMQISGNYWHWCTRLNSLLSRSGLSEYEALKTVQRELKNSGVKRTQCSCCD